MTGVEMSAAGIPYIAVSSYGWPIQPFGVFALLGVGLGSLTTVLLGRKRGVPGGDLGLIVPLAAFATLLGAHWFDVLWYQWDAASADPKLWIRVQNGMSVYGGTAGAP